ncbi:DEAD/DEAH box helicase [Pelagibacterium montanilacus]|uniref:DEAD/DEAH box helicase n=1 Tax=Pelagibacterium montanilacus TaxID=2185280 RepID=UPI000F8D9B97|nr:DEAD/DEAH box helicase [Pelagibacterium montanilacus]
MQDFQALGLHSRLVDAVAALGYDQPTPIQAEAIPHVLAGRDLMGLAQTGTGKTAAFGLPLITHLLAAPGRPAPRTVKALILAPTRELVNQIATNLRALVRDTPIRVNHVVGGMSINGQIRTLSHGSDILVATPGRLLDLVKRQAVRLDSARYLVLDEADQMLDLGFIHALRDIARLLGSPRQTLLFSATMPAQMVEISRTYLTDPVRVQVAAPGKAADKVDQTVHFVETGDKISLLSKLLGAETDSLSLVFTRTKHGADKLAKKLESAGYAVGAIHGNKSQGQRDRMLKAFRDGTIRVLVATDVAARGLDIPGVTHVYNFDLPEVAENYVHRIGRTARAGADGKAVALCAAAELDLLGAVEKLMGITVPTVGGTRPEPSRRGASSKSKGKGRGQSGRPVQAQQPKRADERPSGRTSRRRPRRAA